MGEEPAPHAGTYLAGLGDHEPPLPQDLAYRVFREYERRKAEAGELDFEDLLERTIQLLEEDEEALATVRDRWRAFTVDEYQDVNVLQQTLLDLWLGDRDDLCVVGDDYQSIYGFTGASAEWLLALPRRFPQAHVVRLEQNYRSTPQVLALANRLAPKLGGSAKELRADASGRAGAGRRAPARTSPPACASWRLRACRSRRWPCSCARTRARRSSRRRSTRRGSRSRVRRCSRATRHGRC